MQGTGPIPAEIMIIGEAPGSEEERLGKPFIGPSGHLLDNLLRKAGLDRGSCFVTNVCRERPPGNDIEEWVSDRKTSPGAGWTLVDGIWLFKPVTDGLIQLAAEIREVRPKLIIPVGNLALWSQTRTHGNWKGISKWRGSRLSPPRSLCPVVPTFHPAAALREMELASIILMDLKRAKAVYEGKQNPRKYEFETAPTFSRSVDLLTSLLDEATNSEESILLSGDLETRAGHIACFGISWGEVHAHCIPFLSHSEGDPFYWSADEEAVIVHLIIQLFNHPKIQWVGQNFLYDCQYFYRFFGCYPKNSRDTMIGHHSIYSNMRKGLDFLSSMYAQDHVYWKDEGKNWEPSLGTQQFWEYNCKDACITWEIWHKILEEQFEQGVSQHFYFQQSLFDPVLRMMNRGVRIDVSKREEFRQQLVKAAIDRQENLDYMCGHPMNPRSHTQLKKFFYDDLNLPEIRGLGTDKTTIGSHALQQIADRNPVLRPICQLIVELRSIGVFLSTFVGASLDTDGRMRCSFSVAGPTTFRFSSYENAFGSGMNLQNVPVAEKEKVRGGHDYIKLPNIRKLFVPDPGCTFFDLDLDRADMQVVAWESNDTMLKTALKDGIDIHCLNACEAYDIKGIPYDELRETHPNYKSHRERIGKKLRDSIKNGGHACDYGVGERKLAQTLGITVHEASRFRSKWFALHPGILSWHRRTETLVQERGFSENKFGARLYNFGRFDLPEHLAWLPQSTVAGVINRALIRIDQARQGGETSIELLLQVHDSLAGQFETGRRGEECERLRSLSRIIVPYEDELVIPVGIKTSTVSWGDCK